MIEQLKYLVQLQTLENTKKCLIAEYNEIPRKKAKLEKDFQEFENTYLMKKTELEHLKKQHRDLERQISILEDRLKKSRQKESEVKTNKEYKAILKEQEDIKLEIAQKEDSLLECMEKIDHLQKELAVLERELTLKKQALKSDIEKLDKEAELIKNKIEKLESLKDEIKGKLSDQLRKKCEFLMLKQDGIAVAPVDKGICQVCHVSLPPQKFIELQKDKELMNCPHCHRFIYWPQHEKYMIAEKEILSSLE